MARISVRHSVAAAYGLLFGRPLTVIGLTWLPAAFYLFTATYLIAHMNAAMALEGAAAAGRLGDFAYLPNFIALLAATALFGALISVSLTRQAFGLHEEAAAAHLVLGMREFRLFLALLRYYAIVVGAIVVFALVAGIAISQLARNTSHGDLAFTWQSAPLEIWLNSGAAAIAMIFGLACAVRYGFFLPAVATVEDGARLSRAQGLSQGNFWTLAAITLIVGAPAGILLVASEKTLVGLGITGVASANALPFAAILTLGLIVLQTLFAGASAGAYSEMAEAHVEDFEPSHRDIVHEPASIFAAPQAIHLEDHEREYEPIDHGAAAQQEASFMEVATPEADGASAVAHAHNWMAPEAGIQPVDSQGEAPEVQAEPSSEMAVAQNDEAESEDGVSSVVARLAREAGKLSDEPAIGDATTAIVGVDSNGAGNSDHASGVALATPPFDPAGVASTQHPAN